MKKTRLRRFIAASLSLLMLLGCFSFTAVADEGESTALENSVTSYDIEEVKALLNAISYTDYVRKKQSS